MKRLVFQSYPNNEVRIGFDTLPYPKKTGGDLSTQKDMERRGKAHDEARQNWLRDNNILEYRDAKGQLYRSYQKDGEYVCDEFRAKLVITSEVQEVPKQERDAIAEANAKPVSYVRFTRNGRHRLLEAGALCEEKRGRGNTGVFVTFTLPGSSRDAYAVLARCSGYIVNCVCQCIRDNKWAESYFWVWERQKRGALHLHLFISLRQGTEWDCYRDALRDTWYDCLLRVGQSTGTDMFRHGDGLFCTVSQFWRYDYQEVYKSVGAYLSKYVSKDAERGFTEVPTQCDVGYYPRRWWYMSRDLTQEINNRRKTICVEGLSDEDILLGMDCMDAMATSLEPVLQHEYDVEIGRVEGRDGSFGRSFRRIFWFPSEHFADIEIVLRTEFLRAIASMQRLRLTYKGAALDYGGERLPIPS